MDLDVISNFICTTELTKSIIDVILNFCNGDIENKDVTDFKNLSISLHIAVKLQEKGVVKEDVLKAMQLSCIEIIVNFTSSYISYMMKIDNVQETSICIQDILALCFKISCCTTETIINNSFLNLLKDMKNCDSWEDHSEMKQLSLLNIINRMLQSIPESYFLNNSVVLFEFFSECMLSNPAINVQLISTTLPLFIEKVDAHSQTLVLNSIWDYIQHNFFTVNEDYCKNDMSEFIFITIDALTDVLMKTSLTEQMCLHEVFFWKILFAGLSQSRSHIRKRCHYIFKKILNWAKVSNERIVLPVYPHVFFQYDSTCPDIKDSMPLWDELLSLFEALEQKQIHIIEPHLPKFLRLLEASKNSDFKSNSQKKPFHLNALWVIVLLQRMWKHDAKYVRNWSTICVLQQRDAHIIPNLEKKSLYLFLEAFFKALNDTTLYARPEQDVSEPFHINSEMMKFFFIRCCNSFPSNEEKGQFIQLVLRILSEISFSAVPLLYIIKAVSRIQGFKLWKKDDVSHILKLLTKTLQLQEKILRQAIALYLLTFSVEFLDMNELEYSDITSLINAFMDCNVLVPKSSVWVKITKLLKEAVFKENCAHLNLIQGREFCNTNLSVIASSMKQLCHVNLIDSEISEKSIRNIARTWAVFAESDIFCPSSCEIAVSHQCLTFSMFFNSFIKIIEEIVKQNELQCQAVKHAMSIYFHVVDEIWGKNILYLYDLHINWSEVIDNTLVQIIGNIFNPINTHDDLEWLLFSVIVLDAFLKRGSSTELISDLLKQCLSTLQKDLDKTYHIQLWCCLGRIAFYSSNESLQNSQLLNVLMHSIENGCLNFRLQKPNFPLNEFSKKIWVSCVENACINICHALLYFLDNYNLSEPVISSIYDQMFLMLEDGTKEAISLLFKAMGFLLSKIELQDRINEALAVSWNCLEHCNFYRPILKAFIHMIIQPHLIKTNFLIINQYVEKLKSLEDRLGFFNLFFSRVCHVFKEDRDRVNTSQYGHLLALGLVFGPIRRKDQRATMEAIEEVVNEGLNINADDLSLGCVKLDFHIRVEIIHVILTVIKVGEAETFASFLIEELLRIHEGTKKEKPSHFLNSYHHRVQNRVWQSILLLNELLVTQLSKKKLLLEVLARSFTQSSQTSVKHFQVWTILRIIKSHPELVEDLFAVAMKSFESRPAHQVLLLSLLTHLVELDVIGTNHLAMQWLPIILKFCVSHSFEVRVYATLALKRLWEFCVEHSLCDTLKKFDFIQNSELTSQKTGNFSRNMNQLGESYYFSYFHPLESFTLQAIFVELPSYTHVTHQEWIEPEYFSRKNIESPFPKKFVIFNQRSKPIKIAPVTYNFLASGESASSRDISMENFQRKIIPQKLFGKSKQCKSFETEYENKSGNFKEDLIVVASLVEKLPNLGGLCRSCEALGVTEFVIKDLKCIEDKKFQNLSVTAEKWINISEVKIHKLKSYLKKMKSKNYTVIGCEQTEKSHDLTEFTFPQKCLILLGNEKEGIPVDLLDQLDISVEIPQCGVVRSLNVHVAGALLIYEFFRQRKHF